MKMSEQDFQSGKALPFKTQDAVLANCLRVAGLIETSHSPVHVYDADILFKIGGGQRDKSGKATRPSRFAGLTSIEAARKAHAEGARGRVEYHFEHSHILEPLLLAYKDQVKQIEEGEGDASDAIREIMRRATGRPDPPAVALPAGIGCNMTLTLPLLDEREALLRILCVALKLRIEFVNRWKNVTPVLVISDISPAQSHTTPDGVRVERSPGGKFVPINASDEILRRMKLL
jgi:hypothetical protein